MEGCYKGVVKTQMGIYRAGPLGQGKNTLQECGTHYA